MRYYPDSSDPATRPGLEHCVERALPARDDSVMLGVFLPSQAFSEWPTLAPNSTEWTYQYILETVLAAEEMGMSFALPPARWAGLEGDEIVWRGASLETVTLTAALLAATTKITLLTTINANLHNPVVAAKFGVGLDHIGGGRWGFNVVSGWGVQEFAAMGVELLDHKERYAFTREWLDIIQMLWREGEATYDGQYFTINKASGRPRPMQVSPLIVNAGQSYTGMRFSAERADYIFCYGDQAEKFRKIRGEVASNCGFIGAKAVILGKTTAEAQDRANQIVDQADRGALRNMLVSSGAVPAESADERMVSRDDVYDFLLGEAIIASAEDAGTQLADWAAMQNVDGICLNLFEYRGDLKLIASDTIPAFEAQLATHGKTYRRPSTPTPVS
ncbi:LLM class flavin-dependent oxidoreductase [Pseudarthrobacter siccitolerans]